MPTNLIQIKAFLGKYYPELAYSSNQEKYAKTGINKFFEQRFAIQTNKSQMIVDPMLKGLAAVVSGNEIFVSKELYDHEYIEVTNSLEGAAENNNPKSLYTPDVFSTVAYLISQNHTMFQIVGEIEEPIYIRYKSEYETFYNSVIIVNVAEGIDVEVVEEFESLSAINSVINYIVQQNAKVNVTTFYQNRISAMSFCLRNVITQANSKYSHMLFGKGSSTVVDETKLHPANNATIELLGCINPGQNEFHAIVGVQPSNEDYNFLLEHKHVVSGKGRTTFTPVIVGHLPSNSHTSINSLILDHYAKGFWQEKTEEFLSSIVDRATLDRTVGVTRFYNNKSKFLQFQ